MVLAVYDLFKNHAAQVLYLPPFASSANLIYPSWIPDFLPITCSLNAVDYLKAYGIACTYEQVQNHPYSADIFRFYTSITDNSLNSWLNQAGSKSEASTLRKRYLPQYQKLLHKDETWYPDSSQLPYIKGGWFEHYIGEWLLKTISEVFLSVKIANPNTTNELDLIFTYHNVLYVIEAKTSVTLSGFTDYLYKLDSLGKKFGLYPRSCIAIADKKAEKKLSASPYALQRAAELKIPIFTYQHLNPDSIQATLSKWILDK